MVIRRLLILVTALAGIMVVGIATFLLAFDINRYRDYVESRATELLGRPVKILGPITLTKGLRPSFELKNLQVANPDWASRPHLATVEHLNIQFALLPLLKGQFVIQKVYLNGFDLMVEENLKGTNNWMLNPLPHESPVPNSTAPKVVSLPVSTYIDIQRGKISYGSTSSRTPHIITINSATILAPKDKPMHAAIHGLYDDLPMSLQFTGESLATLVSATQPWAISVNVLANTTSISVQGQFPKPLSMKTFTARMLCQGDTLKDVGNILSVNLPDFGSFEIDGDLLAASEVLNLKNVKVRINRHEAVGEMMIFWHGSRIHLDGRIMLDTLSLNGATQEWTGTAARLTPISALNTTIPQQFLNAFDARVAVSVKHLYLGIVELGAVDVPLQLRAGFLTVGPFRADHQAGDIRGNLYLDVRGEVPTVSLEVDVKVKDATTLLQRLPFQYTLSGTTDISLKAKGHGITFFTLLNNTTVHSVIHSSRFAIHSPARDDVFTLHGTRAEASVSKGAPIKFHLDGMYREKPLSMRFVGGSLASFFAKSDPWPILLSIQALNNTLEVQGVISPPLTGDKVTATFSASGKRLGMLVPQFSGRGPYRIKAQIIKDKASYSFQHVKIRAGNSDVTGTAKFVVNGPRPRVDATLTSQQIQLGDFASTQQGRSALDQRFPVEALRFIDANVAWNAARIRSGTIELLNVTTHSVLKDGRFEVTAFKGTLWNGKIYGSLLADTSKAFPYLKLNATTQHLDYGHALRALAISRLIEGVTNMDLSVSMRGNTLRELLRAASLHVVIRPQFMYLLTPDKRNSLRVEIHEAVLTTRNGGALHLTGKGTLQDLPLTVTASGGSVKDLLVNASHFPLSLSILGPDVYLDAQGGIPIPLTGEDLSLQFSLRGEHVRTLGGLFRATFPKLGPYDLTGMLAQTKHGLQLTKLNGHLGENDVAGHVSLGLTETRIRVTGKLTSKTIELNATETKRAGPEVLGNKVASQDLSAPRVHSDSEIDEFGSRKIQSVGYQTRKAATSRNGYTTSFFDWPLPVNYPGSLDLDLDWQIKHVRGGFIDLGELSLGIRLDNGRLSLSPIRGRLSGGTIDGQLEVDTTHDIPRLRVSTAMTHFDYGRLLKALTVSPILEGVADFELDLEGQGATLSQILNHANGRLEVTGGPGKVPTRYLDLWASNLVTALFSAAWEKNPDTLINCMVMDLDLLDGLATTDAMLVDATRFSLAAAGILNLRSAYVDLVLTPQPKDLQFLSLASTVRVSGPFATPNVALDPLDIAESKAWQILGAIDRVGQSLTIPNLFSSNVPNKTPTSTLAGEEEENPCLTALNIKEDESLSVTTLTRGFLDEMKGLWKYFLGKLPRFSHSQ